MDYSKIRKCSDNGICAHGGKKETDKNILFDFSANVNPFAPSKELLSIINGALKKKSTIVDYPDPKYTAARTSIATYENIGSKENIILTNGEIELIKLFCEAFIFPGDSAIIIVPTFCEYERFITLNGGNAIHVSSSDIIPSELKQIILDQCTPTTKACFICNPNNPTGMLIDSEKMLDIASALDKKNIMLYVDEAFIDYNKEHSVAGMILSHDNIFVGKSLTKILGIPGIRIGYGIGCKEAIKCIENVQVPWSVNSIAREIAENIAHLSKSIDDTVTCIINERERVEKELKKIKGIRIYPSSANFFMIYFERYDSMQLYSSLKNVGLLVRNCHSFKGGNDHCIRVAIRTKKENNILIESIRKLLDDQ